MFFSIVCKPLAIHETVHNYKSRGNKSSSKLSIFCAFRIFQSIESGIYCMSNEIIQINNAVVSIVLLYLCLWHGFWCELS